MQINMNPMQEILRHPNGYFIEMAEALLKENGIPTYMYVRDVGGYSRAMIHTSIVGPGAMAVLCVPVSAVKRAMTLLKGLPFDSNTATESLPW